MHIFVDAATALSHFAKEYNARVYRSSYIRGEKRLLMQAAVFLLNGASNEGSGDQPGSIRF